MSKEKDDLGDMPVLDRLVPNILRDESKDWLNDDLCNYTGDGSDLPTGGYSTVPGWNPEKVVRQWMVEDVDADEGFSLKHTRELVADDIIVGTVMNLKALAVIVSAFGRDFYTIEDANGERLTLDKWYQKYGTNGLGLVAIRNMREELTGGGVHYGDKKAEGSK